MHNVCAMEGIIRSISPPAKMMPSRSISVCGMTTNWLKKLKQQIGAFALRHGHQYTGTKWTNKHVGWLKKLELDPIYRETLNEYMALMMNRRQRSYVLINESEECAQSSYKENMGNYVFSWVARIRRCPLSWRAEILPVLQKVIHMGHIGLARRTLKRRRCKQARYFESWKHSSAPPADRSSERNL